nr:formin-like protein 5 [Lolium perenne]
MPDEHRPPATGTPPTPTEACPATHAARGIVATPPRSRSSRSGFHAQQADPSRRPVAVPRRTGKGRRTPASLPHTVALRSRPELRPPRDHHAKEELGRHIPVTTASPGPLPQHPRLRPAAGAEDADRPPLPAACVGGMAPSPPTPLRRPRAAALASLSEADMQSPKSSGSRSGRTPTRPPRRPRAEGNRRQSSRDLGSVDEQPPPQPPARARRLGILQPRPPSPPRAGPPPRAQELPDHLWQRGAATAAEEAAGGSGRGGPGGAELWRR